MPFPNNRKVLSNLNLPSLQVGEVINVLIANTQQQTTTVPSVAAKFIQCGGVYSQNAYPELYARLGLIGAVNFTPRTSGTTSTIRGIIYGNGLYAYVWAGTSNLTGGVYTSTDAITWTSRTSGLASAQALFAITYGNGLYVVCSTSASIYTSTDAITWTSRTFNGAGNAILSLAYGNGLYLYGTSGGGLSTSTDGITWTSRTSGSSSTIWTIIYGNGLYLFGGYGGSLRTSTDGITWTSRTSGIASDILSITYNNGLYIYVAQTGLATSTDGITWTSRTSGTSSILNAVIYGNGLYVYSGVNGALGTSTDGITWTSITSGTVSTINGMAYGNGLYVYAGVIGILGTSTNPTVPQYSAYYDATTSFYVPPYTSAGVTPVVPTVGYSFANNQAYIKAMS